MKCNKISYEMLLASIGCPIAACMSVHGRTRTHNACRRGHKQFAAHAQPGKPAV